MTCYNQALLKAVLRWTGDGPKQTMVNAPDADILREIIELLKQESSCEGDVELVGCRIIQKMI
jgi:hypothetical protein